MLEESRRTQAKVDGIENTVLNIIYYCVYCVAHSKIYTYYVPVGKMAGNRESETQMHHSSLPRGPHGEIQHSISAKSIM